MRKCLAETMLNLDVNVVALLSELEQDVRITELDLAQRIGLSPAAMHVLTRRGLQKRRRWVVDRMLMMFKAVHSEIRARHGTNETLNKPQEGKSSRRARQMSPDNQQNYK